MTKDLALLVGRDQQYLSTGEFIDKLDENLKVVMKNSGQNKEQVQFNLSLNGSLSRY